MQRGRSSKRPLRAWLVGALPALLAISATALALAACGTSSSTSTQAPASTPHDQGLLSSSDLHKYPPGSPQQTFLSYWSDLQFQSWADVGAYYDPRFRDFVGTAAIIGAKKLNASSYQSLKPHIARVKEDRGATTIYYTLDLADGSRELASTTWRKDDGNWQIIYDSRLDAELNQFARNRIEIERNGSLPTDPSKASPEAAQAGEQASQKQAQFLQQELETEAP